MRRAFDKIHTDFIAELLEMYSDGRYPGPDKVEDYMKWDVIFVLGKASSLRDEATRNLAWRIVDRRHPKAVYETTPSPDPNIARKVLRNLLGAAEEQFPDEMFWVDQAVDHPDRFRIADINIKYPGNPDSWRSFEYESKALQGLGDVAQVRLYADVRGNPEKENEIVDFCRRFMA